MGFTIITTVVIVSHNSQYTVWSMRLYVKPNLQDVSYGTS